MAADVEWSLWNSVSDLAHLRELVALFCEGKLSFTPGHDGPREPETEGHVGKALAHANRSGLLTTNSQNGQRQPAYVQGLADDATVARLRKQIAGTRLRMRAGPMKFRRRGDVPSWRTAADWFQGIPGDVLSQVTHLNYVQIVDPKPGPSDLLWKRLSALGRVDSSNHTATPTKGATMASIEEVRAGIGQATDKASESLGGLQKAHSDVEQAQGLLQRAADGSSQADAPEAIGLFAQAIEAIAEVQQMVSAAIQSAEAVAARL